MVEPKDPSEPTFKQLRAFVTAAELRERTAVCDRLGTSRQNLDNLLGYLDKTDLCTVAELWLTGESGTPRWPFELTSAGIKALPHARQLQRSMEMMYEAVSDFKSVPQGKVRISCFSVHMEAGGVDLRTAFMAQYPGITVEVTHVVPEHSGQLVNREMWEPLRAGRLDFAFGGAARDEFHSFVMYTTRIIAAVRADHPWRRRGHVDLEDVVKDSDYVVLERGYYSRMRLEELIHPWAPKEEMPTVKCLLRLRDAGAGNPIIADDGIDPGVPTPHPYVRMDGQPISLDVCVHWRRGVALSPQAEQFLSFIKSEYPGAGRRWSDMQLFKDRRSLL